MDFSYFSWCPRVDLKKYEEAIEDFTQAITIKPDVAVVYQMRGIAEFQASQYEKAVEDFTQAITIESDYAGPIIIAVPLSYS